MYASKTNSVIRASLGAIASGSPEGNFSVDRFRAAAGFSSMKQAKNELLRLATPCRNTGLAVVVRHPRYVNTWMPTKDYAEWMAEDPDYTKARARMTDEEKRAEAVAAFVGLEED